MGKGGLIFGLLMLGVGIGIGALLFGGDTASTDDGMLSELPDRDDARVDETSGPMLAGSSDAEVSAVRAAIDAIPAYAATRVDGQITGTVKTEAGEPLAGAEVSLRPPNVTMNRDWRAWQKKSMEETLPVSIAIQKYTKQHSQVVTTDAEGKFAFGNLIEGEYGIGATHPDYNVKRERGNPRRPKAGDEVTFTAMPVTGVRLEIRSPGGEPLERVSVRFTRANNSNTTSWNEDTGIARVGPGTYRMTVTAGRDRQWSSAPVEVEVAAGEVTGPIDVVLQERPEIVVTLDFGSGEPRGIRVKYVRVPSAMDPDPDLLAGRMQDVRSHRGPSPKSSGNTTVLRHDASELEDGRYIVAAFEGGKRIASELIELVRSKNPVTLTIPPPEQGRRISVLVRGPKGAPVSKPSFMVYAKRKDGGSWGSGAQAKEQGDGEYWLEYPSGWPEMANTTMLTVRATVPGWGQAEATRPLNEDAQLRIDFEEPASVEIALAGVHGTLYEGAVRVTLTRKHEGDTSSVYGGVTIELDSKGRGKTAGVQPGTYNVTINLKTANWHRAVHNEERTIRGGASSLRLDMPSLSVVTVRAKPGTQVHISRHMERSEMRNFRAHMHFHENGTASTEGIVKFVGVPAGKYNVHASGETKVVEVARDMEVRLGD